MNPPGLLWLQADLQVHSARTTTSLRDVMAKSAILAKQPAAMDCARQPRVPMPVEGVTASSASLRAQAKQSISPRKERMDCFASLAMTARDTCANSYSIFKQLN
jgi:hypothetical protein